MDNPIFIEVKNFPIDKIGLNNSIIRALKKRKVKNKVVELHVVGRKKMARLNLEYMHKTGATDVLSFPLESIPSETNFGKEMIGTIVLCNDIIGSYVKKSGNDFSLETEKLIFHGVDHLLGIHHK